MTKVVMTYEGRMKLENDLNRMRGVEMKEILNSLFEAREKGDISENAEYDVAKEALDMHNIKIQQIEEKLKNCVIINKESVDCNSVQLLTSVRLKNTKTDKEIIYTIVPENEVNIKEGKISHSSPIGKGLIGNKIGDVVNIDIPSGKIEFQILDIKIA